MKRKSKQILAIFAIVLLLGLYSTTLIFALIDAPWAANCFRASVFASVAVPVLLYAVLLVHKHLTRDKEN